MTKGPRVIIAIVAICTVLAGAAAIAEEQSQQIAGLKGWIGNVLGGEEPQLLPVEEAFVLSFDVLPNGDLRLSWQVAEHCYLYRDKLKFRVVAGNRYRLGAPALPEAVWHDDPSLGSVPVYPGDFAVTVPVERLALSTDDTKIEIGYQGCAGHVGVCYPPQFVVIDYVAPEDASQSVNEQAGDDARSPATVSVHQTTLPTMEMSPSTKSARESTTSNWQQRLQTAALWDAVWLSIGLGLLIAFTACMYPLIPILSSLIVGQGERASAGLAFMLSLAYVEGMALTFGVLGAVIAAVGDAIGLQAYFQSPWVLIPFALLFVLLALSMFGFFALQVPAGIQSRLTGASNRQRGGTLLGVTIMGMLSALIVGPCGGPILIAELAYAAASADPLYGFVTLFAFGNGLGLPLLVIGVTGGSLLPKAGAWMDGMKAAAGVVLLGLGIYFLERMPWLFPPALTMTLWATLLVGSGVFLGALEPAPVARSIARFWKALGLLLVVYGSLVLFGGLTGGSEPLDPLRDWRESSRPVTVNTVVFEDVDSVAELEQALAAAGERDRISMVDVTADWCAYCEVLEHRVFTDAAVQRQLTQLDLLKVDVTPMRANDTALLKRLGVTLPPTLLFFAPGGAELREFRVVGEISADVFARHLVEVLAVGAKRQEPVQSTNHSVPSGD